MANSTLDLVLNPLCVHWSRLLSLKQQLPEVVSQLWMAIFQCISYTSTVYRLSQFLKWYGLISMLY